MNLRLEYQSTTGEQLRLLASQLMLINHVNVDDANTFCIKGVIVDLLYNFRKLQAGFESDNHHVV